MPIIRYEDHDFRESSLDLIKRARQICEAYASQGFRLSLRQLYYQFVARGWLPNKQSEYKRLGSIITDARLAGLLDWDYLEDRGRTVQELPHWESPESILEAVGTQYRVDKWEGQPYRPVVLVEKDALSGVLGPVCEQLDVPLLACKGYSSASTFWEIGHKRLKRYVDEGQTPVILHFGDHDPSGIDMTRDVGARLSLFMGEDIEVRRLALNYDQVQMYNPPPNPAKETDSRAADYIALFGHSSWELDALEPTVLADLVEQTVLSYRDDALWEADSQSESTDRETLMAIAQRWDDVRALVEGSV